MIDQPLEIVTGEHVVISMGPDGDIAIECNVAQVHAIQFLHALGQATSTVAEQLHASIMGLTNGQNPDIV